MSITGHMILTLLRNWWLCHNLTKRCFVVTMSRITQKICISLTYLCSFVTITSWPPCSKFGKFCSNLSLYIYMGFVNWNSPRWKFSLEPKLKSRCQGEAASSQHSVARAVSRRRWRRLPSVWWCAWFRRSRACSSMPSCWRRRPPCCGACQGTSGTAPHLLSLSSGGACGIARAKFKMGICPH